MNLTVERKLFVTNRIKELSDEEKERVEKMYLLLDKIELYKIIAIKTGAVIAMALIINIPGCLAMLGIVSWGIVAEYFNSDLLFFGFWALTCPLVYIILRNIFLPRTKRIIKEIETLLLSEPQSQNILEKIKEIDPDMIRNIGRILPK